MDPIFFFHKLLHFFPAIIVFCVLQMSVFTKCSIIGIKSHFVKFFQNTAPQFVFVSFFFFTLLQLKGTLAYFWFQACFFSLFSFIPLFHACGLSVLNVLHINNCQKT